MNRLLDNYPDAPDEVRAALAEAIREAEAFSIPPTSLGGGIAGIRRNMAARQQWRTANPAESQRYDAVLARIERLEREAQVPRADVVDRELRRCGVPDEVLAAARSPKLDTTREAIAGVREWAETPRSERLSCILLTGSTGTGKSVAAAWTSIRYAQQRRWWQGQPSGQAPRVAYAWLHGPALTSTPLVMGDLERQLERAQQAELLVIDELEVKGGKEGLLKMASLLNTRFDGGRFTIVTTNAGREELAGKPGEPGGLGPHVADRLLSSRVVAIRDKQSMRRKGAA